MINPETIRRLRSYREWPETEQHILDSIATLDTNADIEGDDRAIAIEVIARKRATETLKKILRPFVEFREPPDMQDLAKNRSEDAGL